MSGPTDGPTSVYKYYDAANRLIYIGITAQRIGRQVQHNDSSEWWPYVARQEIEHYPSRADARAVERGLIELHRPPFNKQHNDRWEDVREAYLAVADADRRLAIIQGGGFIAPSCQCTEFAKYLDRDEGTRKLEQVVDRGSRSASGHLCGDPECPFDPDECRFETWAPHRSVHLLPDSAAVERYYEKSRAEMAAWVAANIGTVD